MGPANWHWRQHPSETPDAVIVDIDGVISDAAHRQHLLAPPAPDWTRFFERAIDDEVVVAMANLLTAIGADHSIVLLSARPLWSRSDTVAWLERFAIRWDLLILREEGSYLDAPAFKARSVGELRTYGMNPVLAFDDDPRNVAMYDTEKVPCIYIHSGYYPQD